MEKHSSWIKYSKSNIFIFHRAQKIHLNHFFTSHAQKYTDNMPLDKVQGCAFVITVKKILRCIKWSNQGTWDGLRKFHSCGQNLFSSLRCHRNVGIPLLSDAKESLAKPLSKPQNSHNNYLLKNGSAICSYVFTNCTHFTPGRWLFEFIWFIIKILGADKYYLHKECSKLRSLGQ